MTTHIKHMYLDKKRKKNERLGIIKYNVLFTRWVYALYLRVVATSMANVILCGSAALVRYCDMAKLAIQKVNISGRMTEKKVHMLNEYWLVA